MINLNSEELWLSAEKIKEPPPSNHVIAVMCPICGRKLKGANLKQRLARHVIIHSKSKPFQCPYCPHASNREDNMKLHIKNYHLQVN